MKKISIIIISYNRPSDAAALLQNITGLHHRELLQEVILLNNQSTEPYSIVEDLVRRHQDIPMTYLVSPKNKGVAGGRNFAAASASGEYLFFIDDDVLIEDLDLLPKIVLSFEVPAINNRTVAVLNYKVLYADNRKVQRTAFPHKDFKHYQSLPKFYTYYYVGCAHAMLRVVWQSQGGYPEDFFYGMEEYDLGYRILNEGYAIGYDDSITVLHKESSAGRTPRARQLQMMWINKCRVAWKYLPVQYFFSTALMWSIEYIGKVGFSPRLFFQAWQRIFMIPGSDKKQRLSENTMSYLRSVHARIWY